MKNSQNIKKIFHEKKIFYTRLEFVKDFLFSLLDKIDKTYLGDNLMSVQTQKEHFEFCFDYTISKFNFEYIYLKKNPKLENILFLIFFKFYYDIKKSKKNTEDFKIRFSAILSYSDTKTETQIDTLLEIYGAFHESLGDYLIF